MRFALLSENTMVQNIRSSAHTLHGAVCFLGDASGRRLAKVDGTTVKEFSPYARVLLPFQRGQRHTPMSGASRPSHFCNRNPGVESLRRFESRSATNQERDGHGENSESSLYPKKDGTYRPSAKLLVRPCVRACVRPFGRAHARRLLFLCPKLVP